MHTKMIACRRMHVFLPKFFFAWKLLCTSACFLERVLFGVDMCVFAWTPACFLTFFFSFIYSQPCSNFYKYGPSYCEFDILGSCSSFNHWIIFSKSFTRKCNIGYQLPKVSFKVSWCNWWLYTFADIYWWSFPLDWAFIIKCDSRCFNWDWAFIIKCDNRCTNRRSNNSKYNFNHIS